MAQRVPLADLVPDPGNPRVRTERGSKTLLASMRQFGPARSAVVDGQGIIRAGHGTIEAAKAAGITEAIIVDAPDDALVIVRKPQWSEEQAKCYTVTDNQCTDLSLFEDEPLIARLEDLDTGQIDLTETGFTETELAYLMAPVCQGDDAQDEPETPDDLFGPWESDNDWGVPTLLLELQAASLPTPIMKWGGRKRKDAAEGMWHFYTDDYKFWGLNRNPQEVVGTGVKVVCEPNYSTWPEMARAEALWWIYSKRLIARWWQSRGLQILVDINVDPKFFELALLGVPHGWSAYSTRWHRGDSFDLMETMHDFAVGRAGHEGILFVVFGGGAGVRAECLLRGWEHVPEDSDRARGRDGS